MNKPNGNYRKKKHDLYYGIQHYYSLKILHFFTINQVHYNANGSTVSDVQINIRIIQETL